MSSNTSTLPIYTIQVGTAGVFTNDSQVNVSAIVNAEISACPIGDQIKLIFNPGTYGIVTPILLPSNTTVIGNNSTLQPLLTSGWTGNSALLANSNSYELGSNVYVMNTDGSKSIIPNTGATTQTEGTVPAASNTNISVQGMTFNDTGQWIFGTWFTNATNIDVQNNTYIGGPDGNAFVNVVNGVVANNIAIGQVNCAYDNWNGPTNVTVENNTTFMNGTNNSGWSVLLNSTPSGDPANPGNALNDGVINNQFSGNHINSSAVNADALLSYGFTSESYITLQGNVDSTLGSPNPQGFYSAAVSNEVIQNNLVSGVVASSGSSNTVISAYSYSNTNPNYMTVNGTTSGNLVFGGYSTNKTPYIENDGSNPTTNNNAVLDVSSPVASPFSTTGFNTATSNGNINSSADQIIGSGVTETLGISAPPTVFIDNTSTLLIPNIQLIDLNQTDTVEVTLTTHFGILSFSNNAIQVTQRTSGNEQVVVLNGNITAVNSALQGLQYTSSVLGWDDSIEITVADRMGLTATRYVPVVVKSGTTEANQVTIIPPGLIAPSPPISNSFPGQTLPSGPTLGGSVASASSGNNTITMGATISIAFLGSGDNTVEGGVGNEYITGGSGKATIDLSSGGDVTVAGGSGLMSVNASTGNDLVEAGASTAIVYSGSGANTVLGGLGSLTVQGGSGSLYIATLPQDGGTLLADLGTGNATILALSGDAILNSHAGAQNLIYLGLGQNVIRSFGTDLIYTGAGSDTVDASLGGIDTVFGGVGGLLFVAGSGASWISPAGFTSIEAGTGNLTVASGGAFNLDITFSAGTSRTVILPNLSDGVKLTGFSSQPIISEVLNSNTLDLVLSDNTTIQLLDLSGQAVNSTDGFLQFDAAGASGGTITINVDGLAGISSDGTSDDSGPINASLATIAAGTTVELNFGSGTYDLQGTLNTTGTLEVCGTNTTLVTGAELENLTFVGGGDVTVEGGTGGIIISAATGNNLFDAGIGGSQFLLGNGSNTIKGGIGAISVDGGTGQVMISSLLQGAIGMNVSLGSGGGIIYALSGQNNIQTDISSNNTIFGGNGSTSVRSAGFDIVYTGSGAETVNASLGGTDTIHGGTGTLTFIGGAQSSWIAPAGYTNIIAGTGDLVVTTGGAFNLEITSDAGAARSISLPGLSDGVQLIGYGPQAIISEDLTGNVLNITLTDNTKISLIDVTNSFATLTNGFLGFNSTPISPDTTVINVNGLAGISTDGSVDDSIVINNALAASPTSTAVQLDFGPGIYNLKEPVDAGLNVGMIATDTTIVTGGIFETLSFSYGDQLTILGGIGGVQANIGSGDVVIDTNARASDTINTGVASAVIRSFGTDLIYTGAGSDTVDASLGGIDTVFGGVGGLLFVAGSGASWISPAGFTSIEAGTGNLTVASGGAFNLDITFSAGTSRTVILPNLSDGVKLTGFSSQPIISEVLNSNTLDLVLSDNTTIQLLDLSGQAVNSTDGFLQFDAAGASGGTITINVDGLAGISSDGTSDDSGPINASLATIAAGTTVELNFGSGTYDLQGTLNTTGTLEVCGTNTTLVTGAELENLTFVGGGDVTVEGGTGGIIISAATGNNLFDAGIGGSQFLLGNGSNTIKGGIGAISVDGGTGQVMISSLLQGAIGMNVSLGSGGGIIYALSGQNNIQTDISSNNTIFGGNGSTSVRSAGFDIVYTGSGAETVNASLGGTDTIHGGTGTLTFIGGAQSSWIAPAGYTNIIAGTGDLVVTTGGAFNLEITSDAGAARSISLPGLSDGVQLIGYGPQAIISEDLTGNVLNITLTDNTKISLIDVTNSFATLTNGFLGFNSTPISPDTTVINVNGLAGISTDGSVDDSIVINNALAASPTSTAVQLDFGPGIYNLKEPVDATFALSTNVVLSASAGQDTIVASASDFIEVSGRDASNQCVIIGASSGGDTVNATSENAYIVSHGSANVIGLGGNSATILSQGIGDIIAGYNGNNIITATGVANILIGGGSDTVYATGMASIDAFFLRNSGGKLDFINQSNQANSVTGGNGSVTVYGGGAGGYYQGGSNGNNLLLGSTGTGAATLIGSGTNNFLSVGGSGYNSIFCGNGLATVVAGISTHSNLFQGGNGTDSIVSYGSGVQNFFVGNGGSETLIGSTVSGAENNYYFNQSTNNGGGTDVLIDFRDKKDHIKIDTLGPGHVVIQNIISSNIGGNVSSLVFLSNNTLVKFVGITFNSHQISAMIGSSAL